MPDSRYAIENVAWDGRNDARIKPGPKQVLLQVAPGDSGYDAWQGFQLCVPAAAYEELHEVTCELVAAIEAWKLVEEPDADITNNLYAAVARFKGETQVQPQDQDG